MDNQSARYVTGASHGDILVLSIAMRQWRDVQECHALRDEVLAVVDSANVNKVVLDLRRVEYIGSIGLLALLGLRRQLQQPDSRIVVCHLSDPVRDMFLACRMMSLDPSQSAPLEVTSTVEDALSCLGADVRNTKH